MESLSGSQIGQLQRTYSARGLTRYLIEIRHVGLNKFEVVKGDDQYVVKQKAITKTAQWDEQWFRKTDAQQSKEQRNKLAEKRAQTAEEKRKYKESRHQEAVDASESAKRAIQELTSLLSHTLQVNDAISWESLLDRSDFKVPRPQNGKPPAEPQSPEYGTKPSLQDFQGKKSVIEYIFSSLTQKRLTKERLKFEEAHLEWEGNARKLHEKHLLSQQEYKSTMKKREELFQIQLMEWESEKSNFLKTQEEINQHVFAKRADYLSLKTSAVYDYCEMVLMNSRYPDIFPCEYLIDYNENNRMLVVEYQLPDRLDMPTLKEVKYIATQDTLKESFYKDKEIDDLYDSVVYQVSLRTIHELFEADTVNALESIAFNGIVHSIDRGSGQLVKACILSLHVEKNEFSQINLAQIDPKACFKKLKGVGSSQLHSLTPVAPIVKLDTADERFISGREVVAGIDESTNLAAMNWEDFEHLIRQLFEKEFMINGGEVKVTRGSRDGGVDAIAFDPDPIRGGKIVIQAKRYTATVGVSAVRDLYGTLLNEGASKGILVSTSDYGPDAYAFAKDKPIALLNGGNLLHLLQKHGHRARINIEEARLLMKQRESV